MDARDAVRATIAGPWGPLHVAATDRGVVAVSWGATAEAFDHGLSRRLGVRIVAGVTVASTSAGAPDRRGRHLAAGIGAI